MWNSKSLLSFCAIICRISPENREIRAAMTRKPDTISVGILGTRPVARYSPKTGTNRISANSIMNSDMKPKIRRGL